jgi:copper chaperone
MAATAGPALAGSKAKGHDMEHLLTVSGISCGHCERAITMALQQLDPQAKVEIDRQRSSVRVDSEQPRDLLVQAITEEGHQVAPG